MAIVVFKIFNIPAYTAKDNLYGICLLLLLFGFAGIQMVHLCEKLFNDASLANMYILCLNILIALTTITTIILIDLLGESEVRFRFKHLILVFLFFFSLQWSAQLRDILNRAFLILPQHALADGLVEICKNYVIAEVFSRYYIDTYKSPIGTSLVLPHYIALICLGVLFWTANYMIECGVWRSHLIPTDSKRDE